MNNSIEMLQGLNMWSEALPEGWRLLSYGIDDVTRNKYVRIVLPNGLLASLISGPYTYGGPDGLWELGPCWYFGGDRFSVMYGVEMRGVLDWRDVQGYIKPADVMNYLTEMAEVPKVVVDKLQAAYMAIRAEDISWY